MQRGFAGLVLAAGLAAVAATGRAAVAQVSLADDIILAVQGEQSKQQAKKSELGRAPGAPSPLYANPSRPPLTLQEAPGRPHREFLRRTSRVPADEMSQKTRDQGPARPPSMRTPRLDLPSPVPEAAAEPAGESDLTAEDAGPPGALTLDQAIDRLVVANNELRTKFHEIPMAEADVLTASLRENPLAFYDTTRIPYGSYSGQRPGDIEHGVSLVFPVDYNGKRKARMAAARAAKHVREAQYQDAVRMEIDNLYSSFVDVLEARDKVRCAEASLRAFDRLFDQVGQHGTQEQVESLLIDRETAALRLDDEQKRLLRAKQVVAESLALPPDEAAGLELYGSLHDTAPPAPPAEELVRLALHGRPDIVAHRLGVPHALAELERAKSERLPNAYFLYTPFGYVDRRAPGERDSQTWGIGVFLPLPLYDRNQGNIERSQLNVGRTQAELTAVERQAITEVNAAVQEYLGTRRDLDRLERQILPLIQKKRENARKRLEAGKLDAVEYVKSLNEHQATISHYRDLRVRHRRSMLDLNTAVGCRVLP